MVLFHEIVFTVMREKCADLMELFTKKIMWLNCDEITCFTRKQNEYKMHYRARVSFYGDKYALQG
jgi:hypothetical protein